MVLAMAHPAAPLDVTMQFRRPTREHAIELAVAHFLAGDRVEMRTIAEQLDISRTTLNRWVCEREQLLGEVFARLSTRWHEEADDAVRGDGLEAILVWLRCYLVLLNGQQILHAFAEREPGLALRLVMSPGGVVALCNEQALRDRLAAQIPGRAVPDEIVHVIAVSATTLVWANLVSGYPADVDGAVAVARTLISASV